MPFKCGPVNPPSSLPSRRRLLFQVRPPEVRVPLPGVSETDVREQGLPLLLLSRLPGRVMFGLCPIRRRRMPRSGSVHMSTTHFSIHTASGD